MQASLLYGVQNEVDSKKGCLCAGGSRPDQRSMHASDVRLPVLAQMEELELVVDAASALIDRHVTDMLLSKCGLIGHCHAVKRYLLLSQARSCPCATLLCRSEASWLHLPQS